MTATCPAADATRTATPAAAAAATTTTSAPSPRSSGSAPSRGAERPGCSRAAATAPPTASLQPTAAPTTDMSATERGSGWRTSVRTCRPPPVHQETCGTAAPFMQPAFPSKTFPNHYTIVTGLYPESNGLIDNSMYDPVFNASFSLSSPEKDNPAWYLGQPIWHTAKYQGLKSGTFFWPGSDVKINGSFPDIYRPYNGKVPFEERVLTVLKWLQLPEDQRPDFYTLYLEEPDKSGHSYGPVSGGLVAAIQGVDKVIGQLMNGLKQIGLHRCLNIVIVADHGMEDTSCDRKEALQLLVGDVRDFWVSEGTFGRIRARTNAALDSAGLVANMTCRRRGQRVKAYLKAHLPKRLHFANSRRIEDVNVLVEPRWLFERYPGSLSFCSGGAHGYDNDAESMQVRTPLLFADPLVFILCKDPLVPTRRRLVSPPLVLQAMFLSYGPAFRYRTEIEPFSNIELYNLMCEWKRHQRPSEPDSGGSLRLREEAPAGGAPPAAAGRPAVLRPAPGGLRGRLQPGGHDGALELLQPSEAHLNETAEQRFDALLTSNVVPMYREFKKVWDFFLGTLLVRYAARHNGVNVVTGPAFDFNHDGRADSREQLQQFVPGTNVSVPTHFFAVLTSCRDAALPVGGCVGELQAASFLLPHRPDNSESCKSSQAEAHWVEDLVWFHKSRVRDVELITGLDFYQGSGRPIADLLRMKTRPTAAIHREQ
ncbi:ectonucleotide pyrophosphatase/phosphodiesterase family member 3 isoform X4 [Pseudoliparis swirei]|uniref:ectonucleotide pyrophosphatase/phosphodiesterase family member 3 isoform X4 n=1 Tax=Pseudoliparis swirei TaxID=2059687 RepID=UPI0024BDCC98|nr:ectonucleotide pyrophosphatase/phosphodiesterase family member 3 isoform X4 [Pseudoliparis swirei]